ncbi:MAG: hypothetical protein DRI34_11400 [Deltaproteobacteria bacterium]|nr:MAG: hypothetical protein DRI34_11400 [Deltaproteobacteria bacterium]
MPNPRPASRLPWYLLLLVPLSARAVDFTMPLVDKQASLEITETLVGDYHDDNFDQDPSNDGYGDLRNRLNLRLAMERWTLSLRLDASLFIEAPSAARPPYRNRLAPEKWYLKYRARSWQLQAGDFYASFGRGLALGIRKVDQLGEDTSIMGIRGSWHLESFSLTVVSGLLNPSNTDGVTEKTISDWVPRSPWYATRSDWLSGLRAEWRPLPGLSLAGHVVGLVYDPYRQNQHLQGLIEMSILPRWATIAGSGLDWAGVTDWLDVNLEFNWLHKDLHQQLDAGNGWGLLAGSNIYLGNWTLVAEAKFYDDYELYTETEAGDYLPTRIDVIRPPTLEPAEMEIANNRSVAGGRLRLSWRPGGGGTLLEAAGAGFWARATAVAQDRYWIYNVWLTAEQSFLRSGLARCILGLREEVPLAGGGLAKHLVYLYTSASIPLWGRHSLELSGNNWWEHKHNTTLDSSTDFVKGEWSLGWSWSPLLTASVLVGYDSESSGSRQLEIFYTPAGGSPIRQVFLAGDIMLNFSGRVILRLLAGQLRGGAKCINGLCRIFPPFAGVKLETTVRF